MEIIWIILIFLWRSTILIGTWILIKMDFILYFYYKKIISSTLKMLGKNLAFKFTKILHIFIIKIIDIY